jgi:hypothetical protein
MRVEGIASSILTAARERMPAPTGFADLKSITGLLSRQASSRMGIVESALPGAYKPLVAVKTDKVETDIYEERQTTRAEAIHETRDVTQARPVYEVRDVYETRDIYEMRDIFETRDVTETRATYETQAIYESRENRETRIEGNRDLRPYNTLAQAGIDVGANFSVKVGDAQSATFRFDTSQRLSVTVNGATQRFEFSSANGSMRDAIVGALNSVEGLTASLNADGELVLVTDDARQLVIADIANGLLDFSRSPLAKLGLQAGTTQSSVIGHQQVQIGTRQVVTGHETVVIGSEDVVVGSESVITGSENVLVGSEQVQIGTETIVIGSQSVKIGERTIVTAIESVKVGTQTTEQIVGLNVVGLVENIDQGTGGATVLDRLQRAASGDHYMTKLFEAFDNEGEAEEAGGARRAYREMAADGPWDTTIDREQKSRP